MAGRSSLLGRVLGAVLLFAACVAANAAAVAAPGAMAVLERVTGRPVIYSMADGGMRRVSLIREGAQYRLPIEIETGPADAASFRLPDGEVAVAPGTSMRIAAPVSRSPNDGTLLQRVFQRVGSALFSVERREVQHFEVETPFLVSVVKGTTFTVVVHDDGATVSLHEGHLQVDGRDGLGRVELWPGDVAYSGPDGVVQKLVGTLTRRSMADEALPERENPAAPGASSGSAELAERTARPIDRRGGRELPAAVPDAGDLEHAVALDDALERAAAVLPDAGDLALVELADGSDLVRDAALPDDLLTNDLGLGDDLDLAASTDLAAADLLDDGAAPSGLADDLGLAAGDLVADLGAGTGDLVADLGGTAGDLVGGIGDTAGELLGGVGDATGGLLGGVGDTAGDLLGGVGDTAGDLLGSVGDTGGALLGGVGDTAGDLLAGVGGTAGTVVGELGDGVGGLVGGLTDGTTELLDQTGSTVGDLAGTAGDTVGSTLDGVSDVAGGLVGAITNPGGAPVQDLADGLDATGSEIVSGGAGVLGDDLTEVTERVLGNVTGLLRGLRL